MNSANYAGLSLCPVLGFGLLLGAVIWLFIRSPKAGAVGAGVLAVFVLAGLALFSVRVQVNPSESPVAYATPWWGIGARLKLLLVGAFLVGLIGLVAWGFARNPKKGLAAAAGVFVSLLLLAIFAIGAAILLPAWSRSREQAARTAMMAPPPMTAPLPFEVGAPTTGPSADALANDPWVVAAAASEGVAEFACRELACAAMSRKAIQTLRTAGRIAGEAGPRFILTMEARDPTTLDVWKRAEPAMCAAVRAEFQERADRLVEIAWNPNSGPGTPEAEHLLGGAVLRWSERPQQGGDRRTVTAELFMPAERHVRLARDGQRPSDGEVRGSVTETNWRNVVHRDKSWVLGREWPAGRPGPFIVGRSGPVSQGQEARQTAEQDARRQLAGKIRAQLTRVIGLDPVSSGPDSLLEQARKLVEEGTSLAAQAGEIGLDAARTTAVIRGPEMAAPTVTQALAAAASSLRRESSELSARASRAATRSRGRDAAALAKSQALSQSAAALAQRAEAIEKQMHRVSAAPSGSASTLADEVRAEVLANNAEILRREAERIREQAAQAMAALSPREEAADAESDARLAAVDAVATRAVAGGGRPRLDDYAQVVNAPSRGRWMAAILIDASPSTIDALVAEAFAQAVPGTPRFDETARRLYTVGALLLMIILAYAFLAAGRYAHFKWPVRIVAVVAFAAVCVIAMRFSGGFSVSGDPGTTPGVLSRAVSGMFPLPSLSDRLVALARTSADGVATAVATAESADIDDAKLKPLDLLVCGEYLLLGGRTERAVKAIETAIRRGGCENWYQKSLGLALLHARRPAEAKRAFDKAAGNADAWKRRPVVNASPDAWTAAYFLDLVSEAEYTNNQAKDASYACFPWFYVGQRMEIEGKRQEAMVAYQNSVQLGRLSEGHYISHWSAYRLRMLLEAARTPASRRVSEASSSQPAEFIDGPAGGW